MSLFCTVVLALNFKSSFIDKYISYYFPTETVPIKHFINSQQTILHFYQPQRNLYVLATNPLAPSNSLDLLFSGFVCYGHFIYMEPYTLWSLWLASFI